MEPVCDARERAEAHADTRDVSVVRTNQTAVSTLALPRPELVPVEALRPYARNARTHSKRQINEIARSIDLFGFNNPVLIDASHTVLCGAGRLSKQRALIKALTAKALQGDTKALASLLSLHARMAAELPDDQDDAVHPDELAILRRFAPELLKPRKSK